MLIRHSRRAGFTIIELFVVISIVAILITLTVAAIAKFTNAGQASATRTTLQRLDGMFRKQIATTNDRARKQIPPDTVLVLAGDDPERAKVIWLKLKLKQKYPVTFAEVFNPAPGYLTPVPAYVEYLRQFGITAANAALLQPEADSTRPPGSVVGAQSAACLLMALRVGPDALGEDELSTGSSTVGISFIVAPPGQPLPAPIRVPCLIDAWGTPLTFCRWPVGAATTGASTLFPGGYASGYSDPVDPNNVLLTLPTQNRQVFEQLFHRLPPTRPPAGQKMVLSPVIVSSGNDELLGLNLFTLEVQPAGSTESDDNIFSVEVR